jgi:hypothetical protein
MDLLDRFERLHTLEGGTATPQTRGREFEVFLRDLLAASSLDPRLRIRPAGEEIDGSFVHHHRAFLVEAKWTKKAIPASTIYAFKGKVDGKLVGTIGTFISISGYSGDAVDALRVGKALNIVLFNDADVRAAIDVGFDVVLDYKLRAAADTGELMVEYQREIAEPHGKALVTFVVENAADAFVLRGFAEQVRRRTSGAPAFSVVSAQGRLGLGPVASALARAGNSKVAIVADASPGLSEDLSAIRRAVAGDDVEIIAVSPTLTAWITSSLPPGTSWSGSVPYPDFASLDLEELLRHGNGFDRFTQLLDPTAPFQR